MDVSPQDRDLMVRTVLGEAASEPEEGKAAVASVILNRLRSGEYGKTAGQVILQPNAFEPWSTRRGEMLSYTPKSPAYQDAASIVDGVLSGRIVDPTGGATHFYSPVAQRALGRVAPSWSASPLMARIGGHNFYAPEGAVPEDLLGSWGSSPAAPAADPNDDLLGSWNAGDDESAVTPAANAAPPSGAPPQRVVITSPWSDKGAKKTEAPPPDDLAAFTNQLLAQHQGDSWADRAYRLEAGGLRGIGDVADTLANAIASTGKYGGNVLQGANIISPETNQAVQDWASGVTGNVLASRNAFDTLAAQSPLAQAGRVGGQLFATAPVLAAGEIGLGLRGLTAARPLAGAALTGAATGAGANALTSAASDQPVSDQMLNGAVAGGLLGAGARAIGAGGGAVRNMIFGRLDPQTAQLADTARNLYGIPVTAGQISASPASRFLDSVMQRLPFTGYGERAAGQQTAFNRAVAQTFGEDAGHITQDVLRNARDRIGDVFDSVAQRTGNIQMDMPFLQRLGTIWNDAQAVLPASEQRPLQRQLMDLMSTRDPVTNSISGDTYQALTRKGAPLDRAMQSNDPNIRFYAGQVREALDDMLQRSAPADVVQDLLEARRQWRALKTVEKVATPKKAPTGDVRPNLLASEAARSYPRGGMPLSDLASIGQRFLTEPPSSGTAERLMIMKALGTGLGAAGLGGAAYAFDPDNFQRNALLAGAALAGGRLGSAALRSNWLANSMIASGLGRAGGVNPVVNLLTRAAPAAGLTYRGAAANRLSSQ